MSEPIAGSHKEGRAAMPTPPQPEPLPLNCSYCGRHLAVRITDRDAGAQWVCPVHGEFRIDATGRLRDVPRA